MPSLKKAIIDNDALVNLTHLQEHCNIFNHLRLVFTQILIPTEVHKEYQWVIIKYPESNYYQRIRLLQKIRPNEGFYALCTRYDTITRAFLETTPGIDKGEAEAAAQYKEVWAYCIISDDKDFTKAILSYDANIKIINSLHLIAMLELQKIVTSCDELKLRLHKIRPFNRNHIREAYLQIAKDLGLNIHKREIYRMTNMKNM